MRLLVATTNPGKLREIRDILQGLDVTLLTLDEVPAIPEPDETGATFAENARQKAIYYSNAASLPTVAEDSGLVIDALDGAPGVQSARWHGSDYQVKFRMIHELLRERGRDSSPARFVCQLALADAGRVVFEARGVVEGQIAREPRGTKGFGYDPIFFYPPFGQTLGEVDLDRKATVSHRGQAFRRLRTYLMRADNRRARL